MDAFQEGSKGLGNVGRTSVEAEVYPADALKALQRVEKDL
jgi:hypothetical protein